MLKASPLNDLITQHLLIKHFASKVKENPNYKTQNDPTITYVEDKGNDGSTVLKVIFEDKIHAQYLVDHLFAKPYFIGSKTNANQAKKVQSDTGKWVVYIALDQVDDYCKKAFSLLTSSTSQPPSVIPPLTVTESSFSQPKSEIPLPATSVGFIEEQRRNIDYVVDLNQFLQSFSLKEHIHEVMSTYYGEKFKGAIIRWKVTPDNNLLIHLRHLAQSNLNAHTYAQGFIQYLNTYIGHHVIEFGVTHSETKYSQRLDLANPFDPNTLPKHKTGHYRFFISLTAPAFFDYMHQVQINGIYFHKTLDELFNTFVFTTKPSSPHELFHNAVHRLLGKLCFDPSPNKDFKWTFISLRVITDYLESYFHVSGLALDVEHVLEEKLCSLISAEQLIMSNLETSINDDKEKHYHDLYWELDRMRNPGKNRAIRDPQDKVKVRSNPLLRITQEHSTKRHGGKRGTSKPSKLHAKRRAGSKPPQAIEKMRRFKITHSTHSVLLFFDLNECVVRHKQVFPVNAATNSQWHQTREIKYKAISLSQLTLDASNKAAGGLFNWNELEYDYPFNGLRGSGAPIDNRTSRLNAIAAAYEAKTKLEIDYEIPILIVPEGTPYRRYPYAERLQDALNALDAAKNSAAYVLISRNNYELLGFIIKTYSGKINNPELQRRVSAVCARLNLLFLIDHERNLKEAIAEKNIEKIFDSFMAYARPGSRVDPGLINNALAVIHFNSDHIFRKRKEAELFLFYQQVFLVADRYFKLDTALTTLINLRYHHVLRIILGGLVESNFWHADASIDPYFEDSSIITQVFTLSIEESGLIEPELILRIIDKLSFSKGLLITSRYKTPSPFHTAIKVNNDSLALGILQRGLATRSSSGIPTVAFPELTPDRGARLLMLAVTSDNPNPFSIEFLCHNGADIVPALEWGLEQRPWVLQFLLDHPSKISTDLLLKILAATLINPELTATSEVVYTELLRRHKEKPISNCDASLFALSKIAVRRNINIFFSVLKWGEALDWETDGSSPVYSLLTEKNFRVLAGIHDTFQPRVLFSAVRVSDDAELIQELIKFNYIAGTKQKALAIALLYKNYKAANEILKNLLKEKESQQPSVSEDPKSTTLHLAVEAYLSDIITEQTLLTLSQDFSIYEANGANITPLGQICANRRFALMEKLISTSSENPPPLRGAEEFVSAKMAGEEVRLHRVSRQKEPGATQLARWLCVNGADATILNDRGVTPFMTAINEGNFIIVGIIIEYCIQQLSEKEKDKAIFFLARAGEDELAIKVLDAMQSQCSYRDADTRQTALHFARNPQLLARLASQFEMVSHVDHDKKTPIDLILARGEYTNLEAFINAAPKKFTNKDFNDAINGLIRKSMFVNAIRIINIAGDNFHFNTDVNSLIMIIVSKITGYRRALLQKLCERGADVLQENEHGKDVLEVALQNADKHILVELLKYVKVVLNPVRASQYLLAFVANEFYDLALELVEKTATFSLQMLVDSPDFMEPDKENLKLLEKLIANQPEFLQYKMSADKTVFCFLVDTLGLLEEEQRVAMLMGLLSRFAVKLSRNDKHYCLWQHPVAVDLSTLFNLVGLAGFDPNYRHQNKTLFHRAVESDRLVDFEFLFNRTDAIPSALLSELLELIIKSNRHTFLPALLLRANQPVAIMSESAIRNYVTGNTQIISPLVRDSIAQDNFLYFSFVCEFGFRVTPEVFDHALGKSIAQQPSAQPLCILFTKSHLFDLPNAKAKLAGNRLATCLNVPIDFFAKAVCSDLQKRLATTAMAFERIKLAATGVDVMNVINVLWNHTPFFKQPDGFKLPFTDTWQNTKVHEEWMWIVKSAKNRLLELAQNPDTNLTEDQVSFINNEKDFTKVAQSMRIYSIFAESKIIPEQKVRLQTQAEELLREEQKKLAAYQSKFNKE